ncbi:energy transducer TonB [Pseudoalteromonas sp. ZZD1]|uniref:energy transducer TonB n=1 Tax=Pseudoalteromonas sp. ZZD1 TaxID=3139395 RepID=UPI003BAC3DB3
MKFIIFLIVSLGCHLGWLYSQPTELDRVKFSGAQPADKIAIKIIASEPVKPQKKQTQKPTVVTKQASATQFHSKIKRLAKQPTVKKSTSTAQPNKTKPVIKKTSVAPDTAIAKVKPVVEPAEKQSKPSQAAPASSAPVIAKQHSLKNHVIDLNTLPIFKAPRPTLNYPLKAKRRGYQGVAILQIELAEDGTIAQLSVLKSSGFTELDKAALNNVSQWQFHPVMRDQHKVKARFSVPIEFSLRS